jgi:uncharacterized membrane protein
MRMLLIPLAALIVFPLGCNKSPEGGTPNTKSTFKISLPTLTTNVKQGDKETVNASIDRGSDFKEDVKLSATAPEKVKVELSKDTIKASEDTKFQISIAPEKDAPLGEHKVKVTGTPSGGGTSTSQEFTIKVVENK